MNLKSYMRGLGIGIIVTAILMGIGANKSGSDKMSTAEENNSTVLADLKELSEEAESSSSSIKHEKEIEERGVHSSDTEASVSDNSIDKESTEGADAISNDSIDNEDLPANAPTILPKAGEIADDGQAPKDSAEEKNATQEKEEAENITVSGTVVDITISSGQSSASIAQQCENLGLVENGMAFDKYLSTYGYDRKLTTGVHHIPAGSTEAQIAQMLTSKGE